jgi:FMN phosphatase YigB (HAD superfamily)
MPPPSDPINHKKLLIFDMDETLIHCVDDIEKEESDIILEINFPDEETVYAGINIRPYIMECLTEAKKHF